MRVLYMDFSKKKKQKSKEAKVQMREGSMITNTLDRSPQVRPRQKVKIMGPTCDHILASSPKKGLLFKPWDKAFGQS